MQAAIAGRAPLPRALAAAIAEVGRPKPVSRCWKIRGADIAPFSLDRIVERFGHLAPIRENLLARDDLPMAMRQALLSKLSQTLAGFVAARQWLGPEHAEFATEKPAKRRQSRSRPTRLTMRSARWCSICVRAASSPQA